MRRVAQASLVAALDQITHPKARARTRRDVSALLCSAYNHMRAALLDRGPAGLANQAGVAAALDNLPAELEAVISN